LLNLICAASWPKRLDFAKPGREFLPLMLATAHNLRNNSGSFAMFTAIRAGFDQNQCERSVGR
jgi:hypothetical protein